MTWNLLLMGRMLKSSGGFPTSQRLHGMVGKLPFRFFETRSHPPALRMIASAKTRNAIWDAA